MSSPFNCHHYEAYSWHELVKHYRSRDVLTLGLTATPERHDGRGLGDIFEELLQPVYYSELIRDGHIVRPVIYGPDHYLGKDFAQDPVETWKKLADNLRGVVAPRIARTAGSRHLQNDRSPTPATGDPSPWLRAHPGSNLLPNTLL